MVGASALGPSHYPGSGGGIVATLKEVQLKGQPFTARWGLAAAQLRGKVYVFGGYLWFHGIEGFFHDLFEIDLGTGLVRRLTPAEGALPPPRFGHTLVADTAANQLILFGGRNGSESFADLWAFDVARNQWNLLAPEGSSLGASGRKRKVNKSGSSSDPGKDSDSPAPARKSAEGITLSPQGRSWHTAVMYRGCLYIYGGWDHQSKVFNDLWAFELAGTGPGAFTWQRVDPPDAISSPPHGRSCHTASIYGEAMYIFGGLRDGDAAVGDMWRFSFDQRTWSPVDAQGSKPSGRTSAAGAVVDNLWIIHGGLPDYPRPGIAAIGDVIEFDFLTSTWSQRNVLLSDGAGAISKRYGHCAITLNRSGLLLIGGAEKYAAACAVPACRLDLLPSQAQVGEVAADLSATSRMAQLNRDRLAELVDVVQNYEAQIRQHKVENASLADRLQALQAQMAALHQQHSALQGAFASVQQTLAAVEQFIPMMRSVGAAIANFGSAASVASAGWITPGSSQSLTGRTSVGGGAAGPNASGANLGSTTDLRYSKRADPQDS